MDTGAAIGMANGVDLPGLPPEDDFRRLMERVRAGCPDAAKEVCSRYGGHIRVTVRRRLHQRMRRRYDSLDFLQDVWVSFFSGPLDEYDFNDPQLLIKYLSDLAFRKVTDEYRRSFRSKKHDVSREQSLEATGREGGKPLDPPVRGPTPSQVAMANERWSASSTASRTDTGSYWTCSVWGTPTWKSPNARACIRKWFSVC